MRPHERAFLASAVMVLVTIFSLMPQDRDWTWFDTVAYFAIMAGCVITVWVSGKKSERPSPYDRYHHKKNK